MSIIIIIIVVVVSVVLNGQDSATASGNVVCDSNGDLAAGSNVSASDQTSASCSGQSATIGANNLGVGYNISLNGDLFTFSNQFQSGNFANIPRDLHRNRE